MDQQQHQQQRVPRRSSSHGTLHSSYSSHSRSGLGPSPLRPLHKPLRSVNEHSTLLPSPGALESMLKTTTETGDIGVFSIKPVPPSPQRISQLQPSPRRPLVDFHRQENSRSLLSYGDTASEIISMYGSESHRSVSSTISPTFTEKVGPRSYSMTTCGSRHLSRHRSTTTLQSQVSVSVSANGSQLQRPRSPFPYPTRLKRPGVRPVSPALTENGRVDYSRMVEIDRISYRTVHGSYRPAYHFAPRRPLALRADGNYSNPSLLHPGPPPNRGGPPVYPLTRPPSAASMASWNTPSRERIDASSSRASSLSSIVNMYHKMPPTLRAGLDAPSAPPPRYYDYTEDFESIQSRVLRPVSPVAPVPMRGLDCQAPRILQESADQLAAVFGGGDLAALNTVIQIPDEMESVGNAPKGEPKDGVHLNENARPAPRLPTSSTNSRGAMPVRDRPGPFRCTARASDIDRLPSQIARDSIDTFNSSFDFESKDVPTVRLTSYHTKANPETRTKSPERHVQVLIGRNPTIRSEQGVILRDDVSDVSLHGVQAKKPNQVPLGDSATIGLIPRSSSTLSRASRSLSGPQPSEPPAQYTEIPENSRRSSSINLPAAYPTQSNVTDNRSQESLALSVKVPEQDAPKSNSSIWKTAYNLEDLKSKLRIPMPAAIQVSPSERSKIHRHKRNQAVLRISTTGLLKGDSEGLPQITPSCSSAPLLSPKPISPARQLRVKNSIPQLMKALPPVPGDANYAEPPTPTTTSSDDDFAEILRPFKLPESSNASATRNPSLSDSRPSSRHKRVPNLHKDLPKLRLKLKTSNSSGQTHTIDYTLQNSIDDYCSIANTPDIESKEEEGKLSPARRRLKLKSSRSNGIEAQPAATVRHNTDVLRPRAVIDMTGQRPPDLFSIPTRSTSSLRQVTSHSPRTDSVGCPAINAAPGTIIGSEAMSEQNAQSPVTATASSVREARVSPSSQQQSSDGRNFYGLKQLFYLRSPLAKPSNASMSTSKTVEEVDLLTHEKKDEGSESEFPPSSDNIPVRAARASNEGPTSRRLYLPFNGRIRAKLSRWVKGARRAVYRYKRKGEGA